MPGYYLGLISGTSADAIDAALVAFDPAPRLHAALAVPYAPALRERILRLARSAALVDLAEVGRLEHAIGNAFADAALALIAHAGLTSDDVRAIGSHGQTVRHGADDAEPYTIQLGDANLIAERTRVTTVADFRRRDLAAGGQGAPLLPALHAALLRAPGATRVVLNLGGIANVTVLPGDPAAPVLGYDTGPANCLLDGWAARHRGQARDDGGAWAATGRVDASLLDALLADPYFAKAPPKSTGREYFNLDWLDARLSGRSIAPVDVQATLVELSARSVADAVRRSAPGARAVLACGGGVHNAVLWQALRTALGAIVLESTAAHGVDPDFVEAMAFAWLARERLEGRPGNLPSVTGARGERVLGGVYFAF